VTKIHRISRWGTYIGAEDEVEEHGAKVLPWAS
jgi:hypothetical protein